MKRFVSYLKNRPLALASAVVIIFLYLVMLFAPFIAPYTPTRIFEEDTFHPANLELSLKGIRTVSADGSVQVVRGLLVRECKVIQPTTWRYARVKGRAAPLKLFVRGERYTLFGIFTCDRHLFGTERAGMASDTAASAGSGATNAAGAATAGGTTNADDDVQPVFLFGADNLGRDLFSRMVYGSRISLTIGFVASAISLVLAILLGGLAGYYGGKTDWVIMRFSEFFMLIPGLYLILFLRSLLNSKMDSGTSYMIITVILSLVGWPGSARTLRGMVHAIKREEFVQDAALEGVPSTVIIFGHIIPQIASLLIVSTTLAVPGFIMSETTLSYLGLGIADPAVSWGSLINRDISTLSNLKNFPWLLTPVWLLLAVTLAFNFLGDALRDYFDPNHVVFPSWKQKKQVPNSGDSGVPAGRRRSGFPWFRAKALHSSLRSERLAPPLQPLTRNAQTETADSVAGATSAVSANARPLLSVDDLHVSFTVWRGKERAEIQSVCGVSFTMQRGEILGIVGESGSGKSVTTTAIPALHPAHAAVRGRIVFDGTELTALSQKEMRAFRGKKIALIFQEPGRSFDPLQNIGSVFFEALRASEPTITRAQADRRTISLLREVGLPDPESRLKSFPHQFSGGQLQRISIALALSQNCELLIADEPTTALDVTIQAQIVSLLATLRRTRKLSIIFISHNIDLVASLCDNIIVMYGGLIMERGTSDDIMHRARHPYTQALLASSPQFGMHYSASRLVSIPGRVTDPAHPEPGCPFAPRCPYAREDCRTSTRCYRALSALG